MSEARRDRSQFEALAAHRSRRSRRREKTGSLGLNLTAMIDVVFLLLLYFLLATSFALNEEAFELGLPDPLSAQATDPFQVPDPPVTIVIASVGDGKTDYRLTSDHPALTGLATFTELSARLRTGRFDQGGYLFAPQQTFILRSRGDTRWEHTVGAFNAVLRADFDSIRLAQAEGQTR